MSTHTRRFDSLTLGPSRPHTPLAAATAQHTRKWLPRLVALVFVLSLGSAIWSAWDPHAIRAWKENASPIAYFTAMAVLPALGMPLTAFYIVAGAVFPLPWAILGSLTAVMVNFSICYVIARSGLQRILRQALQRFDYELPDFQHGAGALRFTLLVRITPGVPNFAKNYLLGVSGVPFSTYLAASTAVTLLYGIPSIVLGGSLFQHELVWTVVVVGVFALLAVTAWLWRRREQAT